MLVSEVSVSEALLGRSQWCLAQLHLVVSHGDEGCRIPSASAGWDLGAHRMPVTPWGFLSSQVRWGGEQGAAGSWGPPIFVGGQSAGAPTGAGNWGLLTSLFHGQVCLGWAQPELCWPHPGHSSCLAHTMLGGAASREVTTDTVCSSSPRGQLVSPPRLGNMNRGHHQP